MCFLNKLLSYFCYIVKYRIDASVVFISYMEWTRESDNILGSLPL